MWIRVCHSGKTGWSKQADDSGIWQSCVNSFILHTIWSFLQSFFSVELGLSCLKYCKSWPLIPTSISVIVRWITWVYLFFVFLVDSGDIFGSGNFCFSTLCWLPTQYFFGGLPICNNHFFYFFLQRPLVLVLRNVPNGSPLEQSVNVMSATKGWWWMYQKKMKKIERLFWNVLDQSSEIDNGYNLANFVIFPWQEDHL